jgi:hypothetical protein
VVVVLEVVVFTVAVAATQLIEVAEEQEVRLEGRVSLLSDMLGHNAGPAQS